MTAAAIRLEPGATLQDRYRVIRFVGRGGMGSVYLCEDLRLPGKNWALKEMILHDPGVAEQVRESFTREAQFLAGLRHRSLPTIVDVFSSNDRQYLVMEFIEGETLAHRIEREGIPSETTALSWGLELAQVLDYLHRQERPIIFRDLKPENIMLSEEGHIKVIDFGLARHFDPGKRRDTQASGTVGYAPPEQWEDSGQSDPRSDIYSFAATLYFVLTGRPPSPVYGSHRIRPYRPDIDPGTEALVLKCLQPKPSQRYASAAELIKDLLLLLSDERHQGAMVRVDNSSQPKPIEVNASPSKQLVRLTPPTPLPKSLPSILGASLVLFLVGLLLPFVNLERRAAPQDRADRIIEMLAETDPLKEQARDLMEDAKYGEAIALLDTVVTRYPKDPEALIMKSNAYAAFQGAETYQLPVISSWHGVEREGIQVLYGLALAQLQLNKARIGLKPLVVLKLNDCRSNSERLLNMAQTIASDDSVPLVIGPYTSQQTRLIAPVANSSGLPVLAPVASDPQVLSTGRHIFSAADADARKLQAVAQNMYKRGRRKLAIFSDSSSIVSRSWEDVFVEEFQRLGGRIVLAEGYHSNQVDFGAHVRRAESVGADCIFLAEYRVPQVLNFCESLRQTDWKPLLGAQTAVFSESLFRRGEQLVEGLVLATHYVPDEGGDLARAFARDFRQTFAGKSPTHREVNSFDVLKLVVEGLDKVGPHREALREYLASFGAEGGEPYSGASGTFALNKALGQRTPYVIEVSKGTYRLLEAVEN